MLTESPNGWYQSTLLSGVPQVAHGYTTRQMGDMKKGEEARHRALGMLFPRRVRLYTAKQVHGAEVALVSERAWESPEADGLVYQDTGDAAALAVFVADCVPILAVDPASRIVGVVHAGWKGTLGGIATHVVKAMSQLGATTTNIMVSLGPHIGMCCYDVPEDRAQQFASAFGGDPRVASITEEKWHVDLGWANRQQLLDSGILTEHIDAPPSCTSCQVDTFFSYRKDRKEAFGEIMGVIALDKKSWRLI